jgi:hypothetical protein
MLQRGLECLLIQVQSSLRFLDCLTLNIKALQSFVTSESSLLATQHHILENLNLHRHF